MKRFAEGTEVSPENSRAEAERLLARYGAKEIGFMTSELQGLSRCVFVASGRQVSLSIPHPGDEEWQKSEKCKSGPARWGGKTREQVKEAWVRGELARRWRVMVLHLKAKLEICTDDPASFDVEFLPHIMLPNGQTVGQSILPQIPLVYAGNKQLGALPGLTSKR